MKKGRDNEPALMRIERNWRVVMMRDEVRAPCDEGQRKYRGSKVRTYKGGDGVEEEDQADCRSGGEEAGVPHKGRSGEEQPQVREKRS